MTWCWHHIDMMFLTWYWHDIVMTLIWSWHDINMMLTWNWYDVYMTLTQCWHDVDVTLTLHWHYGYMTLIWCWHYVYVKLTWCWHDIDMLTWRHVLQVDLLYMQNLRGISSIEEVAVGVNEDNFNEVHNRDSVRMSVWLGLLVVVVVS